MLYNNVLSLKELLKSNYKSHEHILLYYINITVIANNNIMDLVASFSQGKYLMIMCQNIILCTLFVSKS